jgi:hypothetical protein
MLPIAKASKALQECVEKSQKLTNLTNVRPSGTESQAPIKIVDGHPWSPNIYHTLRLLGKSLEEAWEKAPITFKN